MSLSITINNINDLTDAERAVLRYVLDGVPMTDELRERRVPPADGGVAATKKYLELIGHTPVAPTPPLVPSLYGPAIAAPIPASAELDSSGLPWDKRIHSSSRAKVADGTWRKMRGVDDALVATVEAELRAVQAIPVPTPHHVIPRPEDVPAVVALSSEEHAAAHVAVLLPPSAPAITPASLTEMRDKLNAACATEIPVEQFAAGSPGIFPVPTAPAPPAPLTFADLMKHVTPMLVSGKLPQDTLLAVTAEFGLPHLAALGARPDLVEAVRARIDEVVG